VPPACAPPPAASQQVPRAVAHFRPVLRLDSKIAPRARHAGPEPPRASRPRKRGGANAQRAKRIDRARFVNRAALSSRPSGRHPAWFARKSAPAWWHPARRSSENKRGAISTVAGVAIRRRRPRTEPALGPRARPASRVLLRGRSSGPGPPAPQLDPSPHRLRHSRISAIPSTLDLHEPGDGKPRGPRDPASVPRQPVLRARFAVRANRIPTCGRETRAAACHRRSPSSASVLCSSSEMPLLDSRSVRRRSPVVVCPRKPPRTNAVERPGVELLEARRRQLVVAVAPAPRKGAVPRFGRRPSGRTRFVTGD